MQFIKKTEKEGKFNQNYIIIGELPEQEQRYLLENLREWDEANPGCMIFCGKGQNVTESIPNDTADWGIFISGDGKQLREAVRCGMAVVCYLPSASAETPPADMYVESFEEVDFLFLRRVYERHYGIPWTILETERCIVKEFSMDRLDELFALYAAEGMTDYIEPLYAYEQEKEYQEAYIRCMYGFYGYGMWIVLDRETGRMIGRAGVEHREELGGELELGYAIGVPFQGKGYATEVCSAILSYVRENLEVSQICCLIEPENAVSIHLAEKIGFSFECEMTIGTKTMEKYVILFENKGFCAE